MGKELVKQEKNDLALKLHEKGMTEDDVADRLVELLRHKETKCDKNGNAYEIDDGLLALKVIEIWMKLQCIGKPATNNNHLHLNGDALGKLLGQNKSGKKKGK